MNLRSKMLAFILAPVIVLTGMLSVYAYLTAKSALEEQILQSNTATVQYHSAMIDEALLKHEMTVKNLAAIVAAHPLSREEMQTFLKSACNPQDGIVTLCLAFEDQIYVDSDGWIPPAEYDHRKREWYQKALAADGAAAYSDVYTDMVTNQLLAVVGVPIMQNGKKIGVVTSSINLGNLLEKTKEIKFGETGYIFVVTDKGQLISHPQFKPDDLIDSVYDGALQPYFQRLIQGDFTPQTISVEGGDKLYGGALIGNSGWFAGSSIDETELFRKVNAMATTLAVASFFVIVLLSGVILWITLKITRALQEMMQASKKMAQGDFTGRQQAVESSDEIGHLAQTMQEMKEKLRSLIGRVSNSAEQLAASSEELTASAEQSAQAANQIAGSITAVAHGAENQMQAVERANGTVQDITQGIGSLKDAAQTVTEKTDLTAEKTQRGKAIVGDVITQMRMIEDSVSNSSRLIENLGARSTQIGQIVDTISNIAGQTNLLSLNAAIEAARAGEHGKGFAVVAEEVRKLAEQSQDAAKHISELIAQIQADTDKAVVSMQHEKSEVSRGGEVVAEAQQIFTQIDDMIAEVSDLTVGLQKTVAKITENNQQIVGVVDEIAGVSRDTAGETETISAATQQQAASMEEMSTASRSLAQLAQELQIAVSKFRV